MTILFRNQAIKEGKYLTGIMHELECPASPTAFSGWVFA
jgi:hypothetical protein